MLEFFPGNEVWSDSALRLLGKAYQGGCEVNECFRTIRRIRNGNIDSWYGEWMRLASDVEGKGDEQLRKEHQYTAMRAYLRASMYYFQARLLFSILGPHDDPRMTETHRNSVLCFKKAGRFLNPPILEISIPFEEMRMSGYFFSAGQEKRGPALIFVVGADTTPEEAYFFGVAEAQARGISCLILNGPGQASSIILDHVPTRPDYEKPISREIDYLTSLPDVDPNRICLVGHSLGGYYAARAAAYDGRVKACVIWGACFDVLADFFEFSPQTARARCKWLLRAKDEAEAREKLKAFNLNDGAKKIKCPLLIIHQGDDRIVSVSAAHRLCQETTCPKELKIFTPPESSLHCQHDNPTTVHPFIYDWICERI